MNCSGLRIEGEVKIEDKIEIKIESKKKQIFELAANSNFKTQNLEFKTHDSEPRTHNQQQRTTKPQSKYLAIWETVKQIPKGKVATYGDIATLSGLPGQQRVVGYALHNLPPKSNVPWQRVINSQGRISLPRRTGGYRKQKKLLEKEGVVFERDIIDLERFGLLQSLERE